MIIQKITGVVVSAKLMKAMAIVREAASAGVDIDRQVVPSIRSRRLLLNKYSRSRFLRSSWGCLLRLGSGGLVQKCWAFAIGLCPSENRCPFAPHAKNYSWNQQRWLNVDLWFLLPRDMSIWQHLHCSNVIRTVQLQLVLKIHTGPMIHGMY